MNKLKEKKSRSSVKNLKILKLSTNNYPQISKLIKKIKPHEIYHLGSRSFINYDFDSGFFNLNSSINGTNFLYIRIIN